MASRIADSMLLFMGPHQRSIPSYRVGPHCSPGMHLALTHPVGLFFSFGSWVLNLPVLVL
ncbi:hypothetical protein CK203_056972 [Vitis vinifera]|uniref:Uncharacterized protein n=1 Tax=Vitis vinifera TaxID=29760 RepID=A0A438GN14_VITVI|nr:hypothetical protein CK203_056972 [Vitis vinifera]